MEMKEAMGSRTGGVPDPLGHRAALPVPPLARPAIAEYRRRLAEADAALQTYLAGLAAGLGIPAGRIESVDLDAWTIWLRADQSESPAGPDGRGPGSAVAGG